MRSPKPVIIYTFCDKRPDFIGLQYESLQRHLTDRNWQLVVVNNGSSADFLSTIDQVAETKGLITIYPRRNHQNPFTACFVPINYVVRIHIRDMRKCISVIMDSDMFFYSSFSFNEAIGDASVGGIFQQRRNLALPHFWNALFVINNDNIPNWDRLDFTPQRGTDVGGCTNRIFHEGWPCRLFRHTPDIREERLAVAAFRLESGYRLDFGMQIIENAILHYYRGSNWDGRPFQHHRVKTNFAKRVLQNPKLIRTLGDHPFDYGPFAHASTRFNGDDSCRFDVTARVEELPASVQNAHRALSTVNGAQFDGLSLSEPVARFSARHPAWSGPIDLFPSGVFTGGGVAPNGIWSVEAEGRRLNLQWHDRAADSLTRCQDGFCKRELHLSFLDTNWQQSWEGEVPKLFSAEPCTGKIHVHYNGRLGNQLFEFAIGYALSRKSGHRLDADGIDGFPGTFGWKSGGGLFEPLRTHGEKGLELDVNACLARLRSGRDVVLDGYHQKYCYFREYASEIKSLLSEIDEGPVEIESRPDDLVVHIRRADYLSADARDRFEYSLAPMYEVVRAESFSQLVVVTDSPDDPSVVEFARNFNGKISGGSWLSDFHVLRQARKIVISPSTFSWWAAWLGSAERVYFPIDKGIWRKEYGISLWVDDDPRYIKY